MPQDKKTPRSTVATPRSGKPSLALPPVTPRDSASKDDSLPQTAGDVSGGSSAVIVPFSTVDQVLNRRAFVLMENPLFLTTFFASWLGIGMWFHSDGGDDGEGLKWLINHFAENKSAALAALLWLLSHVSYYNCVTVKTPTGLLESLPPSAAPQSEYFRNLSWKIPVVPPNTNGTIRVNRLRAWTLLSVLFFMAALDFHSVLYSWAVSSWTPISVATIMALAALVVIGKWLITPTPTFSTPRDLSKLGETPEAAQTPESERSIPFTRYAIGFFIGCAGFLIVDAVVGRFVGQSNTLKFMSDFRYSLLPAVFACGLSWWLYINFGPSGAPFWPPVIGALVGVPVAVAFGWPPFVIANVGAAWALHKNTSIIRSKYYGKKFYELVPSRQRFGVAKWLATVSLCMMVLVITMKLDDSLLERQILVATEELEDMKLLNISMHESVADIKRICRKLKKSTHSDISDVQDDSQFIHISNACERLITLRLEREGRFADSDYVTGFETPAPETAGPVSRRYKFKHFVRSQLNRLLDWVQTKTQRVSRALRMLSQEGNLGILEFQLEDRIVTVNFEFDIVTFWFTTQKLQISWNNLIYYAPVEWPHIKQVSLLLLFWWWWWWWCCVTVIPIVSKHVFLSTCLSCRHLSGVCGVITAT
jgi:hypothetical protein